MRQIVLYKIITISLCLCIFSVSFFSAKTTRSESLNINDELVDASEAYAVATMKLSEIYQETQHSVGQLIETINDNNTLLGYVFSLTPAGYIVICAHTTLPILIAYSFTNAYQNPSYDESPLHDLIQSDLTSRLTNINILPQSIIQERCLSWDEYFNSEPVRSTSTDLFQQWPALSTATYGGWLETTWSQNAPYNKFCPIDLATHSRSVAGCPSLAMAQILDYHQTINNIMFNDSDDYYHNYSGNTYWIDDDYETYDFPSFPELNTYITTLRSHYQNQIPPTDDDIAALIFACGVAAEQVYNPEGSGTFGVNQALQAYYRFGFNDVELLDDSDTDVYERLKANMKMGLPAHLAVVNDAWTVGHNLVVDGYNTNNYYHLNFGWNGYADGWYLLPEELPYELTVLEGVIVDITDDYDQSHLKATGILNWANIIPGATITESFTIENTGPTGQGIDWEIVEYPSWGEWTCIPANGKNLTTEDGPQIIQVTIAAPTARNTHFTGHITIANTQNNTDFCLIHASLTTPRFFLLQYLLFRFLNQHPHLFPFLRQLRFQLELSSFSIYAEIISIASLGLEKQLLSNTSRWIREKSRSMSFIQDEQDGNGTRCNRGCRSA